MRKGAKLGRPQRMHGLTGTPEFDIFRAMVQRCSADPYYAGISVHPAKTSHHRLFVLKQPYEVALSPERRAAGRPKKMLTHNGETLHLAAWAKKLGLNPSTLTLRMKRGLPVERVLATGEGGC